MVLALAVGVTQYFTTTLMQKMKQPQTTAKAKPRKKGEMMSPEEMQEKMTKSTNLILPFLTMITTLSLPSVLGLYWLIQSLMLIFQYWLLDREQFIKVFKSWKKK
jgi:membrane protein insertase Oxa1/YidC/SpoIIIJ